NTQAINMPVACARSLERKVLAQVHLADPRIGENRRRIALGDGAPAVDDIGAFADIQGFADIVIGDQDTDPLAAKMADDGLDVADGNRIDAGEGFVEEN